jgi:hypothetical protein
MFHFSRALRHTSFLLLVAAFSTGAFAQATYYTNTDNENNAHTHVADNDMETTFGNTSPEHPIEFNVNVATLPQSSANITMRAYDVDEEQGETDDVYINGHYLGRLTGANNVWSVTSFSIDPAWLVQGDNLVEVQVDTSGDVTQWVVAIDWAQLLIDGGGAVNGDTHGVQITGYSVNAGTVTINTSTSVHSTTGGTYRLQISLIDPNGNAVTVLSQDFAAAAGADVLRTANPTYPLASVSGTYTIQAQLFWLDPNAGNFPVQQDIAIAQFTHTAGSGPSNIQNDSDGDGLLDSIENTLGTNPNDADSDDDGVSDGAEVGPDTAAPLDGDADGIIDALESSGVDSDGDGVVNQSDPANGNPCVPAANNAACLAYDSDGDGLTNSQEDSLGTDRNSADSDGDGFNDGAEVGGNVNAPLDTDGDGVSNALESATADTDADGVVDQNDAANGNPCVPNVNSAACLATDSDGDGLTNGQEDALGASRGSVDTDGDGANDGAEVGNVSSPVDTDGDGVIDALESSGVDSDGDGVVNQSDPANGNPCVPNSNSAACLATDSDGDGLTNAQEDALGTGRNNPDTDGDGFADGAEVGGNVNAPLDTDGDGVGNALESASTDTDGDGIVDQNDAANGNPCVPNSNSAACLATDSDGDGLTNAQEDALGTTRGNADSDGDGANDGAEAGIAGAPVDTDGDGVIDALESSGTDTDGDGVADQADAANDNPCVPNSNGAACLAFDSDGDGLTNAQEDSLGTGRNTPDTDGDGANDGAESGDSDGDGIPNALESSVTDTDGDGVANQADPANGNPCVPNGGNAACLATDSDGDGLTNGQEDTLGTDRSGADSDGDGISDGVEVGNPASPTDTDGDGIADVFEPGANATDPDSDNDGVSDGTELGGTPASPRDTDGDGTPDYLDRDSDGDGIPDALESGPDAAQPIDTDGDGMPDFRDLDSDDDTLPDALEGGASGVDSDGDGIDDAFDVDEVGGGDVNQDGVADAGVVRDTDGDGLADFRDVDTDEDGILDSFEGTPAALPDTDGDGIPDVRDLDSDDDGISDVREAGLIDSNADGFMDLGQTRTTTPRNVDGFGAPDFRSVDSNGDGAFDLTGTSAAAHDANDDGRIDAGSDADEDGIRDGVDSAPLIFGTYTDSDADGVADAQDQDLDNDGVPNAADGSDDTDGDGLPNLADLDSDGDGVTDLVEAGGADSNGDGRADNFVDANINGHSDAFETALGGHALPLPDTDSDGVDNHRDLDSDGDGMSDLIENGGTDANGDGRADGADANHNGLADTTDGGVTGGHALPRPDSDNDGAVDSLDLDSDNDGVTDAREGRGDSDHDGVPDSLDSPGQLETAVRGSGGIDPLTVGGLLAVLALAVARRRGGLLARALPVLLAALAFGAPRAADAAEPVADEGLYVSVDVGASRLEPRNRDGGYVVDDDQSLGYRVTMGYSWSAQWSAEAFYANGGKAGISSDNPAVGHLGDIDYRLAGVGLEWLPFRAGRAARFHPLVKFGIVQIENSTSSDQILFEKIHDAGIYFGGGAGLRLGESWVAQGEVVSYDKDELFMTLGIRKHF